MSIHNIEKKATIFFSHSNLGILRRIWNIIENMRVNEVMCKKYSFNCAYYLGVVANKNDSENVESSFRTAENVYTMFLFINSSVFLHGMALFSII